MNIIREYINGNSKVAIYDDGTKVREYEGVLKPVHPESFDCKITNRCEGSTCSWCHEMSHPNGEHADLNKLLEVIKDIPAGVEIAIGGGCVLTHPNLIPFLKEIKSRGLIANMTNNQKHFKEYHNLIKQLIEEKLIYGLGVSISDPKYLPDIAPFVSMTSNLVFHVIMGVNNVEVIDVLKQFVLDSGGTICKILTLGYKEYGLGNKYYSLNKAIVDENRLGWYRRLALHFKDAGLTLSFDNLAIEQLKLKRFFTDKSWEKFYMGSEGSFTMYVDAVKQQYAICSVDPNRVSFDDMSMLDFFQAIKR